MISRLSVNPAGTADLIWLHSRPTSVLGARRCAGQGLARQRQSNQVAKGLFLCAMVAAAGLITAPLLNAHQFAGRSPRFDSGARGRARPIVHQTNQLAAPGSRGLKVREHRRRPRDFGCIGTAAGPNPQQLLAPYPGFGFNFEHLNAINSDLAIKAAIDPVTQLQLRELERSGCSGASGLVYLPFGEGEYMPEEDAQEDAQEAEQQPQSSQPPTIILQELPPQPSATSPPAQSPGAPIPDNGQFEFVLANGTHVEAAAFVREAGEIIYITPEGAKRTLTLADVDIPATLRVNEEHGSTIQLSL